MTKACYTFSNTNTDTETDTDTLQENTDTQKVTKQCFSKSEWFRRNIVKVTKRALLFNTLLQINGARETLYNEANCKNANIPVILPSLG